MFEDTLQLHENILQRIITISNSMARHDLLKMWRNCDNIRLEVRREQVNNRLRTKESVKLLGLYTKFDEAVQQLDQYITLAMLQF
jgi:hypothetical protein